MLRRKVIDNAADQEGGRAEFPDDLVASDRLAGAMADKQQCLKHPDGLQGLPDETDESGIKHNQVMVQLALNDRSWRERPWA